MRKAFGLAVAISALVFAACSSSTSATLQCPSPAVASGGACILESDITVERSLPLGSDTTIDCRGHSITAARAGVGCLAGGNCDDYAPSVPEVGIYGFHTRGGTLKNCVLRGFDFGIVVANAKTAGPESPPNHFSSNTIRARIGIAIVAGDRNIVRDNRIEYGNGANGIGIVAWGDSDYNEFRNNVVVAHQVDGRRNGPQWPGGVPRSMRPDGIRAYSGTQARTVINVIVGGHVAQSVSDDSTKQQGTVIEANDVDIAPTTSETNGYAIVVADQSNCVVRNNTVRRALHGLHVSGHMGMLRPAGTCAMNPSRFCLEARDCSLPGVDADDYGPCTLPEPMCTFSTSMGVRFVANHILGPLTQPGFDCARDADCSGVRPAGIAIYPNAIAIVVENNDVSGAQFAGIQLMLKSVESAVIRRNVVRDSAYALAFLSVPPNTSRVEYASYYGALISHNDFVESRWRPVFASPSFELAAEMSDPTSGEGNYWGRPCPNAFSADDAPRPSITDSHPYGEPVARTRTGTTKTCR